VFVLIIIQQQVQQQLREFIFSNLFMVLAIHTFQEFIQRGNLEKISRIEIIARGRGGGKH
jgi:hypothetical protein